MSTQLETTFAQDQEQSSGKAAKKLFGALIQKQQYVGEVYSIGYESALVQIHDYHRQIVGGIPSLSFLIATRVSPEGTYETGKGVEAADYKAEDASIILLRVMDAAALPNNAEAERIRVETAQRVSGENAHWDTSETMDPTTHNLLSFAGVKCRVIGTFFLDQDPKNEASDALVLRFGSDLSNYYPNRGLKVYKPNLNALAKIVNYRDPDRSDQKTAQSVTLGEIRYASTNRAFQGVNDVTVDIMPADLLGAKSALFGMTRTGKSNTTKIILQSVFNLRFVEDTPLRIGQLVFDYNGEYANDNEQDKGKNKNPSAVKNVWQANPIGKQDDVVTYGITSYPNDPRRKLMLLNFFKEDNLDIGKEIINSALANDNTKFIQNFRQVIFEKPDQHDRSAMTRYDRRVLAYRALLSKAGLTVPGNIPASTSSLFNAKLLEAMTNSKGQKSADHISASAILSGQSPAWPQLATALGYLYDFMSDKDSGYGDFEKWYVSERPKASGDTWADDDLKKILEMFKYPNGSRQIGAVKPQHTASTESDYAEDIYKDLVAGKLVIIDQSSGDITINRASAERIMWMVFSKNQEKFRNGVTDIPEILLYIEEAHNLLPPGSEEDTSNIWARTAKEGAKYHIGMVYATQEVSSIQRNILKATANWFIGHLNNTDETRELSKYYDFVDFEQSIRRAQDRGFLRVKTLSNLFVIPVQVRKFEV